MALLLFAVVGVGLALSAVLYTVLRHVEDRQIVRESLRSLEGYEVATERERVLAVPLAERLAEPLLNVVNAISRRVWPPEYVAQTRKDLLVAGVADPKSVERFLAIRIGGIALAPFLFILGYRFIGLTGLGALLVGGMLAAVAVLGPSAWLNRKADERRTAIARGLPDVLDLLVISVEAGLGFEQALTRTVSAIPGTLSDEFQRMLGEVTAGSTRSDAMRALDARTDVPELRSFVLAILQADTFGVSIGRILRIQAEEMRIKRRQAAQERAMKAPVKMLIPMVFCIFPSLFVVVLAPAILNIRANF
jgi:tight adherence protein C